MDGGASYVGPPRRANGTAAVTVSSITFHDLSYEVTQRKLHKKLPNKTIINRVRLGICYSYKWERSALIFSVVKCIISYYHWVT